MIYKIPASLLCCKPGKISSAEKLRCIFNRRHTCRQRLKIKLVLTATEKQFIKYWEDQRKGGRIKYYLLYIIAGSFIATLVLSFLSLMLSWGFPDNIWLIVAGSIGLVTLATILTWQKNEKRFKAIIQREIRLGMERDEIKNQE